jgi:hypothetical protein
VKLLWAGLLIVTSFFVTTILLLVVERLYFTPHGFEDINPGTPVKPLLLSGLSLLGILSKRLFDAASQPGKGSTFNVLIEALSPLSLIRSIVVCPIVIITFYQSLKQIPDLILVGLIAYQNGFFFESILQGKEKKLLTEG